MGTKEEVYFQYFQSKMHESDLIIKLDSMQVKDIKENGVIYTPWNVVQEMIKIAKPTLENKIIEPSCGHGIFLIGLLYYVNEKYNLEGKNLYNWFKENVVGVEISPETVKETKEILKAYFLKHFNLQLQTSDFTNMCCHDGLTFKSTTNFNLCIGNPPYIRAKNLTPEYLQFLKKTYKSCEKGTVDIYFAFIEKFANTVDKLVFITPNSFLTSKSGLWLKNNIMNKLTLLIDFKEKKVFRDASVYTCIFETILNKETETLLYGNDLSKLETISKKIFFNRDNANQEIDYKILSGVATLCDNVYKVKKINLDDEERFYAYYNSISYEIEKEIIVPYLKLTKVKSQKDLLNIDYMIYPYNDDKTIIKENILKVKYPLAYTYLLAVKEKLLKRDKGKIEKYENWYAYGRKQGLHKIVEKDIVIIPQMIGGECKPHKINIANLLEEYGKFVFTSGFVIPHNKDNQLKIEKFLQNDFLIFTKNIGKPWPGKTESYYSLTIKQLKQF